MSSATVVRYTTRPDAADENERLIKAVFAQLVEERPEGMRYVSIRLNDGVSFVHVALVEGDVNPLTSLSAFLEFTSDIGGRCVDGPHPAGGTVMGDYGAA